MPPARDRGPTSADIARAYIDEHPSIRSALRDDLVNFAFLARRIQAERGLRNEEAIEIALRRYQQEMRVGSSAERAVREVLATSRLEIRGRVSLVRIREDAEILDRLYQIGRGLLPALRRRGMFQIFQGTRALTVLCEDDLLAVLLEAIPADRVIDLTRGLATVILRSDPQVSETPGVLATMVDRLAERGINCVETISVHTDSIFVVRESDAVPGSHLLSGLVGAGATEGR